MVVGNLNPQAENSADTRDATVGSLTVYAQTADKNKEQGKWAFESYSYSF